MQKFVVDNVSARLLSLAHFKAVGDWYTCTSRGRATQVTAYVSGNPADKVKVFL